MILEMLLLTPSNKYCFCLRLKLWKWSNYHNYFAFSVRITVNPFVTTIMRTRSYIPAISEGKIGCYFVVSQVSRHDSQLKPNKKHWKYFVWEGRPMSRFLTMKQLKFENSIPFLNVLFVLLLCVNEDGVGRTCRKVVLGGDGRWGKGKIQPVTIHEAPKETVNA